MLLTTFGIENISAFLATSALVILAPGPANLYVTCRAHRSVREGLYGFAGIVLGDIFLILLSGLGFSALLAEWPAMLWAVKIAGAVYIGWVGIALLRSKPSVAKEAGDEMNASNGGFKKGLLLTAMNPKLILFFGAFFPLFVSEATPNRWGSFMALGVLFQVLNLAYYTTLIFVVSRIKSFNKLDGIAKRGITKLSGLGLLLCAIFILVPSS